MSAWSVGRHTVRAVQGDITEVRVDSVVNAANSGLRGGGGVDGAIHRKGGPSIMTECRRLGGCPTGRAVATTAGHLPAKAVIHAVGPVWRGGGKGEEALLASAYRSSLDIARERGYRSVAFPSLSTGAYGYPIELASSVAVGTVLDHLAEESSVEEIWFVLFTKPDLQVYLAELKRRLGDPAET